MTVIEAADGMAGGKVEINVADRELSIPADKREDRRLDDMDTAESLLDKLTPIRPCKPFLTRLDVAPAAELVRCTKEKIPGSDPAGDGQRRKRPMVEMTIPSSLDPTLAPPGHHVAGLFIQYAPTNRALWNVPKTKEHFADLVFDIVEEYAPGFKDLVLYRDLLSPLDLEQIFGLTGGSISHGSMGLDQLWVMRPFLTRADYTTEIGGLYLCGAGTHPGGGVMGAPGRNATMRVLRDNRF